MEGIRNTINVGCCHKAAHSQLADGEWEPIKAAIIAARPGVDEICVALAELDNKKADSGPHTISLSAAGSGVVRSDTLSHLGGFDKGGTVAAIRALIPKPEPTPREDFEAIKKHLDYWGPAAVRESLARLQENWEQS